MEMYTSEGDFFSLSNSGTRFFIMPLIILVHFSFSVKSHFLHSCNVPSALPQMYIAEK